MTAKEKTLKKVSLKRFLYHFCNDKRTDRKFCFILGSGASVSSGIKTGAQLVDKWMAELKGFCTDDELQNWMVEDKIDVDDLAKDYAKIFDKRFELDEKGGFAELEDIMDNIDPSCGYSVLAQILAKTDNNIVITTNFDSLTEDALFIYTQKKPLVVGHEALAHYIRPMVKRPVIVKIHRDLLLSPINDAQGTDNLDDKFEKNLSNIFQYYTPVVIGYGGNDGSLMGYLEKLSSIEGGIFWAYRGQPDDDPDEALNDRIKRLIIKFDGRAFPIPGFDDLMIQMGDKLEYPRQDKQIEENAKKRADNYRKQIEAVDDNASTSDETKDAVSSMVEKGERDWWYYEQIASKETDLGKKTAIYREGLKEFPDSAPLNTNYAIFLRDIKDNDKAEQHYLKALELEPDHANININYAYFLNKIRKNKDKAEQYYQKALEKDPSHVIGNGNYIGTLITSDKFAEAKAHIDKTLKLNEDANNNLAMQLWFYCYAIFYGEYPQAKEKIAALLDIGITSPALYLNYAVSVANSQDHPEYDTVVEFAKKISAV